MFFIFFLTALFGALLFVLVSHPVHTILSLIVVAISIAGISLSIGAEFLGFLFIVVYVGAIAVLFLFVVMMISVNLILEENFSPLIESFAVLGFALLIQIVYFFSSEFEIYTTTLNWSEIFLNESNLTLFNYQLYTGFFSFSVVSAGLLLLIAMVGSIFLTVQDYTTSKSQLIYNQIKRSSDIFLTEGV